jgi:hypothetical protein
MSRSPTDDRGIGFTISQLISALDDRNVLRAMRLLEPPDAGSEVSANPDQHEAQRCARCITHGE